MNEEPTDVELAWAAGYRLGFYWGAMTVLIVWAALIAIVAWRHWPWPDLS
jgi:hypothetical protein